MVKTSIQNLNIYIFLLTWQDLVGWNPHVKTWGSGEYDNKNNN